MGASRYLAIKKVKGVEAGQLVPGNHRAVNEEPDAFVPADVPAHRVEELRKELVKSKSTAKKTESGKAEAKKADEQESDSQSR